MDRIIYFYPRKCMIRKTMLHLQIHLQFFRHHREKKYIVESIHGVKIKQKTNRRM